jgi:hypothetical protein
VWWLRAGPQDEQRVGLSPVRLLAQREEAVLTKLLTRVHTGHIDKLVVWFRLVHLPLTALGTQTTIENPTWSVLARVNWYA